MSALINNDIGTQFVLSSVLLASLAGSMHCVQMCGPLVLASAPSPRTVTSYHLGRLLGYILVCAVFGYVGHIIFPKEVQNSLLRLLPFIASLFLGVFFIFLGLRNFSGKSVHLRLPKFIEKFYARTIQNSARNSKKLGGAFLTGSLSVLLPCGWLYSFVAAAIATQSAAKGAILLFVFWSGTLPALLIGPIAFQRLILPFKKFAPRISGVLLIVAGLATIGMRVQPLLHSPIENEEVTHGSDCHQE